MARRVLLSILLFVLCVAASKKEATEALLAAVDEGDGDAVIAALQAGADPNARFDSKTPALVTISTKPLFGREKRVIEAFVKAKANVNIADPDGATPLMAAVATDRSQIIEALIAAGAKLEAKDNDGWTAVHYAVANGQWSALDKLIAAKANVNAVANDKYSALMMAIGGGRGTIAEKLLKAGAKYPASWPDNASGLVHAASGRDLQSVRIVLAHEAKIDEGAPDDGFTPLAIAAWNGDEQIVMELLRAGADPAVKDKEGKTALEHAVEQKNTEAVALLGGKWDKPRPKGGKTISVPCPALGGTVESNFALDGDALVVTTMYPHPLSWYFGGGNMNRAETAKKFTYEGSFVPDYTFDNGFSVGYDQYGTSVTLTYQNSKGEERQKQVYQNVLDLDVKKGEESVDLSELDPMPRAQNDNGVLRSRVPLSVLGLKRGGAIRVTAKVGSCNPVVEKVALK